MPHKDPEVRNAYHIAYRARTKEWRREKYNIWKNKDREKYLQMRKEESRKIRSTVEGKSKASFLAARARSARYGMDFSLTYDWVLERFRGLCESTGLPFSLDAPPAGRNFHPDCPSIDRIDSSKGYTIQNCRAIRISVNLAKHEQPEDEFLAMCRAVVKQKDKT